MTVIDYRNIEQLLTEKSKACPVAAETCRGGAATGLGYWKVDVQGIMEGTVPDGYPEPGLFQQAIYLHGAPPPAVNSRGGQGGFGRINAPGAPAAQETPTQGGQAR